MRVLTVLLLLCVTGECVIVPEVLPASFSHFTVTSTLIHTLADHFVAFHASDMYYFCLLHAFARFQKLQRKVTFSCLVNQFQYIDLLHLVKYIISCYKSESLPMLYPHLTIKTLLFMCLMSPQGRNRSFTSHP